MIPVARFALLWAILSNNQFSDARSLKTDKNLENELTNSKSVKAERSHGQALERIRKERLENEELKREVEELHRQEKEERREFNRKPVYYRKKSLFSTNIKRNHRKPTFKDGNIKISSKVDFFSKNFLKQVIIQILLGAISRP